MSQVRVRFEPSGVEVAVESGSTLHAAALAAGVPIDVPCGGAGLCRGCRVWAVGEISGLHEHEALELSAAEVSRGVRLACVAQALGDVTVDTRRSATRGMRIVEVFEDGTVAEEPIAGTPYVAGIDVGTTTLVASLADAASGDEFASGSLVNPQMEYGSDVMSRIAWAPEALEAMSGAVAESLAGLLGDLMRERDLGVAPTRVGVAGNTTMLHLLAGEDPSPLGTAPYEPVFLERRSIDAARLGLPEGTTVETLPGASAFVGGDVVAGVLATHLLDRDGAVVLLDMGTNGEVVVKTADRRLLATSAAAGPALEGGGIECGARAVPGAIERVWADDGGLEFSTIDDEVAIGLCGSGVIDLLATLVRLGVVDATGRLAHGVTIEERDGCGGDAVAVTEGVWLSQGDIRAIQLAMGAVTTALEMLLERAGVRADDVGQLLIAGGFGRRLDVGSLAGLGVVPRAWVERAVFVGNASKAGAVACARDETARETADHIASALEVVELSREAAFRDRFVANLTFSR